MSRLKSWWRWWLYPSRMCVVCHRNFRAPWDRPWTDPEHTASACVGSEK